MLGFLQCGPGAEEALAGGGEGPGEGVEVVYVVDGVGRWVGGGSLVGVLAGLVRHGFGVWWVVDGEYRMWELEGL